MYRQQCIKSVKKSFFGICMAALGNKFFNNRLFLDKIIETFIKIRQSWIHTRHRLTV